MNNIDKIKALIHHCDEQGDFRNGVTCPNGVLDEGSVMAGKIIQEAEEALKAVIADYERMEEALKEMQKDLTSGYSTATPEIKYLIRYGLGLEIH